MAKKCKKICRSVLRYMYAISLYLTLPHHITLWNDAVWTPGKKYCGIIFVSE